jgi:dihydroorotate dehydrogenase electron transfer subunit
LRRAEAPTERRAALAGFEGILETKLQIKAGVKSNSELMPGTWLVWLDAPAIAETARAGQFVMVRCSEDHDPLLRRPLSIHRTDDSGGLALLFEVRERRGTFDVGGRGTSWLSERVPGDSVDLLGPLGNGFSIQHGAQNLLLVAGGIGIAPLIFLAEMARGIGKRVDVLPGAQTAALLYPRDQLLQISIVESSTDDGSVGTRGPVTSLIDSYIDQADQVFACGPAAMYQSMARLDCLRGKSVQVSLEERMACGMGACYGCTVKTRMGPKQVCHDGPVFELSDIVWQG